MVGGFVQKIPEDTLWYNTKSLLLHKEVILKESKKLLGWIASLSIYFFISFQHVQTSIQNHFDFVYVSGNSTKRSLQSAKHGEKSKMLIRPLQQPLNKQF